MLSRWPLSGGSGHLESLEFTEFRAGDDEPAASGAGARRAARAFVRVVFSSDASPTRHLSARRRRAPRRALPTTSRRTRPSSGGWKSRRRGRPRRTPPRGKTRRTRRGRRRRPRRARLRRAGRTRGRRVRHPPVVSYARRASARNPRGTERRQREQAPRVSGWHPYHADKPCESSVPEGSGRGLSRLTPSRAVSRRGRRTQRWHGSFRERV